MSDNFEVFCHPLLEEKEHIHASLSPHKSLDGSPWTRYLRADLSCKDCDGYENECQELAARKHLHKIHVPACMAFLPKEKG